jgi:hypothetical protein
VLNEILFSHRFVVGRFCGFCFEFRFFSCENSTHTNIDQLLHQVKHLLWETKLDEAEALIRPRAFEGKTKQRLKFVLSIDVADSAIVARSLDDVDIHRSRTMASVSARERRT